MYFIKRVCKWSVLCIVDKPSNVLVTNTLAYLNYNEQAIMYFIKRIYKWSVLCLVDKS